MKSLDSVDPWGLMNKPNWLAAVRILLGMLIVYKGLSLSLSIHLLFNTLNVLIGDFNMSNNESLTLLNITGLPETSGAMNTIVATFLSTYIIASHLIGGTLLVFGLFTRWTCLILIPILFGAIVMVNLPNSLLSLTSNIELAYSAIVLIGLVFFFVMGAGANSIDELRRHRHQLENQII